MADHSKPTVTSTYANYTSELDGRLDDLALGLDPATTSPTNVPTNAIRWASASTKWQKWNGSSWDDLSVSYSININGTVGATTPAAGSFTNASYTGTLTGGTGVVNIGSGQVYKDASGNVGIGTNLPQGKFNVGGGRSNFGANSETYSIGLGYTQARVNSGQTYYIGATDSATPDLVFSNAAGTERLRLDNSGNLLAGGTSNPNSGRIASNVANSARFMSFVNSSNSAEIGYIQNNSGTAVIYSTSSDYRLKDNLQPMVGALGKVAQLKPCTYTWKLRSRFYCT
jgi:hypothetical protein